MPFSHYWPSGVIRAEALIPDHFYFVSDCFEYLEMRTGVGSACQKNCSATEAPYLSLWGPIYNFILNINQIYFMLKGTAFCQNMALIIVV